MKTNKAQLIVLLFLSSLFVVGNLTLFGQTTQKDLSQGLVAYWKFDEGEGDIVFDESGNNNDGTIHGATWAPGRTGLALEFDGEDDCVVAGSNPGIRREATVALWIKRDDSDDLQLLFRIKGTPKDYGVLAFWLQNGRVKWMVSTITEPNIAASSCPVSAEVWTLLAGTYDGNELRFYMDGVLESQKPCTGDLYSALETVVGAYQSNGVYSFDGLIDEVRIYNRVLTGDEIKGLYQQGQKKG